LPVGFVSGLLAPSVFGALSVFELLSLLGLSAFELLSDVLLAALEELDLLLLP
jgi:hypothetical protein